MIKVDQKFSPNYVDPSGAATFSRCPAAYLFSRLMGLNHPGAQVIALDYGTDMHLALPHCYDGIANVQKAVDVFSKSWNLRPHGEGDTKRNTFRAQESLEDFCLSHDCKVCPYHVVDYNFTAPTEETTSENEIPFLIDIGGKLPLAGRIDSAMKWKSTGSLFALDYKTASEISPRYFDNFHNSLQACGYTLALSHLSGEHISGLAIEAIRVSPKNAENVIQLIHVQGHQIESFIRFANRTAADIIASCESGEFAKNPTGCSPYTMFGQPGRYCKYKSLCDSPNWKDMLSFYEQKEPWHPFKM